MNRSPNFQYACGDTVSVKPLETHGRVISLNYGQDGETYQIRYWWNGDAKTIWLYPDEIELVV